MLKRLNVKNGIIMDDDIDGIPFKRSIIKPKGLPNVRSLRPLQGLTGITNHNTANSAPTATDENHAILFQNIENYDQKYVSAHIFVDEDSYTQTNPINEICYHAGDGNGKGNTTTIAIEICENGDNAKAELNAQKLNAALMLTYKNLKIYKHQDWSGKFCPRVILSRPNGWENFKKGIYDLYNEALNQKNTRKENFVKVNYNGHKFEIEGAAKDGKNYVHIRELCEKVFDKAVEWNPKTQEVIITDN